MFLTDNHSIREVLGFPFMKDEKNGPPEKFAAELTNVEPLPVEGIGKLVPQKQQLPIHQPPSRC